MDYGEKTWEVFSLLNRENIEKRLGWMGMRSISSIYHDWTLFARSLLLIHFFSDISRAF